MAFTILMVNVRHCYRLICFREVCVLKSMLYTQKLTRQYQRLSTVIDSIRSSVHNSVYSSVLITSYDHGS